MSRPEHPVARLRAEARVLGSLMRGLPGGASHAERIEAFYRPQAREYDAFRRSLLHGREELLRQLAPAPGECVAELGAGTGSSLDFLGARSHELRRIDLVDISPSLLQVARERASAWRNVRVIEADAACYAPGLPLDAVWFSYSLTMMPAWRDALERALALLRPGGRIGVVDFTVGSANAPQGRRRHARAAAMLWRTWFAHDGVRLDSGHLAWLEAHTRCVTLAERAAPLPWLRWLHAPYYVYVGVKP
ncbi:MAG: class I SAM-dependent methyltransferase [Burkholderiales bacterium]